MPAPSSQGFGVGVDMDRCLQQSAPSAKRPRGRIARTAEEREAEIAAPRDDQDYINAETLRRRLIEMNP
jgi:hypothetical protein